MQDVRYHGEESERTVNVKPPAQRYEFWPVSKRQAENLDHRERQLARKALDQVGRFPPQTVLGEFIAGGLNMRSISTRRGGESLATMSRSRL